MSSFANINILAIVALLLASLQCVYGEDDIDGTFSPPSDSQEEQDFDMMEMMSASGEEMPFDESLVYSNGGVDIGVETCMYANWNLKPGAKKTDISIGSDSLIEGVNSAGDIWQLNSNGYSWTKIDGKLKSISVGSANVIFGITSANQIYFKWQGSAWRYLSGVLKQATVASDGAVWGTNPSDAIYYWNSGWKRAPGALKHVSIGKRGSVWGVNSAGAIYAFLPDSASKGGAWWKQISGPGRKATYVDISSSGDVYLIDDINNAYKWTGNSWIKFCGMQLKQIESDGDFVVAVGLDETVWVTAKNHMFPGDEEDDDSNVMMVSIGGYPVVSVEHANMIAVVAGASICAILLWQLYQWYYYGGSSSNTKNGYQIITNENEPLVRV